MKRLTKEQWLDKSLMLVAIHGVEVLKVEAICQKIGVTKGSFYHHFPNQEHFINLLLERWMQTNTIDIIDELSSYENLEEHIQRLDELVFSKDLRAEFHFRAWSVLNTKIRPYIEQVDQLRLEYLIALHEKRSPHASPQLHRSFAYDRYAQFLGLQMIYPELSKEERLGISNITTASLLKGIE